MSEKEKAEEAIKWFELFKAITGLVNINSISQKDLYSSIMAECNNYIKESRKIIEKDHENN